MKRFNIRTCVLHEPHTPPLGLLSQQFIISSTCGLSTPYMTYGKHRTYPPSQLNLSFLHALICGLISHDIYMTQAPDSKLVSGLFGSPLGLCIQELVCSFPHWNLVWESNCMSEETESLCPGRFICNLA